MVQTKKLTSVQLGCGSQGMLKPVLCSFEMATDAPPGHHFSAESSIGSETETTKGCYELCSEYCTCFVFRWVVKCWLLRGAIAIRASHQGSTSSWNSYVGTTDYCQTKRKRAWLPIPQFRHYSKTPPTTDPRRKISNIFRMYKYFFSSSTWFYTDLSS